MFKCNRYKPFGASVVLAAALFTQGNASSQVKTETCRMLPQDLIAVTHDGKKPILAYPAGIGLFSEPAITSGVVIVTKLRNDKDQIIGYAVETEVLAPDSNPAQGILKTRTQWTVVLPGRGSIFLDEIEDSSEIGKKVLPVVMSGGVWDTPFTFITTAGPSPDGQGIIVGGTDEFKGASGRFLEVTNLRSWSLKNGLNAIVELQLTYDR